MVNDVLPLFIEEIKARTDKKVINWKHIKELKEFKEWEQEMVEVALGDFHLNSVLTNSYYFEHHDGYVFLLTIGHPATPTISDVFLMIKINRIMPISKIEKSSIFPSDIYIKLLVEVKRQCECKYRLPDAYGGFLGFEDGKTYRKETINNGK